MQIVQIYFIFAIFIALFVIYVFSPPPKVVIKKINKFTNLSCDYGTCGTLIHYNSVF